MCFQTDFTAYSVVKSSSRLDNLMHVTKLYQSVHVFFWFSIFQIVADLYIKLVLILTVGSIFHHFHFVFFDLVFVPTLAH